MANTLPHIEDLNSTLYLPPMGDYETFDDESHFEKKVREWGLSSTKEIKKLFWYKERTHQRQVTIKGYHVYGKKTEFNTIVIEFKDGNLSCVHPAYLKEMQSPSFGKAIVSEIVVPSSSTPVKETQMSPSKKETNPAVSKKETSDKKGKKENTSKLELPDEKVHYLGTVKQFALSWNHFNEENDEVVVLENVLIQMENPIEVGLAWCAHSKTLKKFEFVPGDAIEFDGKIVKKKLPKGKEVEEELVIDVPVLYKINNPSKIKKN